MEKKGIAMNKMTERKRIYLSSPTMHGKEQEFVKEAFDTNWVAPLGPNVDGLEKELAGYAGISHGAALSSGTAAIHLALKLAGVQEGDIVFVPTLTFSATCNPVVYEKAVPVFIDSEAGTWNMSPEALEKAFEKYPSPKAVIVVHLYGTPAKLDEIMAICEKHGTTLIEDAAESLSSTYKGRQTGTFGKFGIYSFNGNKIITTSGGGMLVSEDEELIKKARFLSTQARDPARHYQHSQIGYNYRMSNIVAGIGRGQLLHLDEHRKKKKEIFLRYKDGFRDLPVEMNPYLEYTEPNFWLSCMLVEPELVKSGKVTPEKIRLALDEKNVESRPIWKPMHLQPVYASRDFIRVDGEDVGADIFTRGLCLPSDIKMTVEEQDIVIEIIHRCFK